VLDVNKLCRFSLSFPLDKMLLIYNDDVIINNTTNILRRNNFREVLVDINTCTQHKIAL